MKRIFILVVTLLVNTIAFAQTQQGYVKTKGRMVNGKLVPGQGLKGATVSIKGHTTVLMNQDNGAFSFPVTETHFRLDSVRKKGYQLVDMEACPRSYKYSSNPIYIVMETPEQQLQDQLNAERKIRRTLSNQLKQREDEIEALKEQKKITDEEYRQALQQLYQAQTDNDKLIHDMAQRYSELDFDQIDSVNQLINECILNGELAKADSILNSKGDIRSRAKELLLLQESNTKMRSELEKSEAMAEQQLKDIAGDCLSRSEMFKLQHQNDSTAYYIELHASLDTTNVEWQLSTGEYAEDYLADYPKALNYYKHALRQGLLQFGEHNRWVAAAYNNIGHVHYLLSDYTTASQYFTKALEIRKSILSEHHPDVAQAYNNLGGLYNAMGDYDKAREYYEHALSLYQTIYGESHIQVATILSNLGLLYNNLGEYDKALQYSINALTIRMANYRDGDPEVALSLNNVGFVYYHMGDYPNAIEYYLKALNAWKNFYGEHHPQVATAYGNLGTAYDDLGDFTTALEYQERALNIRKSIFGEMHDDVARCYNNIGSIYYYLSDYGKPCNTTNRHWPFGKRH